MPYYQEVDIAYQLPFEKTVTYSNHYEYPVEQIIISGNLDNIDIKGNGLQNEAVPENQAGLNTAFSAGPFNAGDVITFDIIGNKDALTPSMQNNSGFIFNTRSFIFGISSLLIAVFLGIVFFRQPNYPAFPEEIKPEVQQLARLKGQLNRSEISEKEYQTERKRLIGTIKKKMGKDFPKSG